MKTIIIACGSGIATSTMIASKLEELLSENNISSELIQCSINEIDVYVNDADLIVSSMDIQREYPIPKVSGTSFLTSIGEKETAAKILEILKN